MCVCVGGGGGGGGGGACVCIDAHNVTCLPLLHAKLILNGNITTENNMKERERGTECATY